MVDFCRELTDDHETAEKVLTPVAQVLLENLYKLIDANLPQNPNPTQSRIAQEALTALSAMAASLKKDFASYYDTLMPVLTRILNSVK